MRTESRADKAVRGPYATQSKAASSLRFAAALHMDRSADRLSPPSPQLHSATSLDGNWLSALNRARTKLCAALCD